MRNWANLPEELLNLILSKVFGKDKHTFGLICRSWNVVASISPYRYSPSLMYYHKKDHVWNFFQCNRFFYKVLPELENAEIRCSKYGWLLVSRCDNSLFFSDPFNNRKIDLPCKLHKGYTTICFFHEPTLSDWLVLGISAPDRVDFLGKQDVKICVLKHGADEWVTKKYERHEHLMFMPSRGVPVLHRGVVYFSDVQGNVATFDVERRCERHFIVNYRCLKGRRLDVKIKEHFLLKIDGEEGVFVMHEERKVKLFRLLEPEMKWELVQDIGNKVLYLSRTSSFGCVAYEKSLANRIYFPTFCGENGVFYSLRDGIYYSIAYDEWDIGKHYSLAGDYSANNTCRLKRLKFASWIMPSSPPELTT